MTDKDKGIVKGLECCEKLNNKCDECPYRETGCQYELSKDALDLINRQQAEIERSNRSIVIIEQTVEDQSKTIKSQTDLINKLYCNIETARAEAIKEFEYKLLDVSHLRIPQKIYPDDIRKVKKEMVGEDK